MSLRPNNKTYTEKILTEVEDFRKATSIFTDTHGPLSSIIELLDTRDEDIGEIVGELEEVYDVIDWWFRKGKYHYQLGLRKESPDFELRPIEHGTESINLDRRISTHDDAIGAIKAARLETGAMEAEKKYGKS